MVSKEYEISKVSQTNVGTILNIVICPPTTELMESVPTAVLIDTAPSKTPLSSHKTGSIKGYSKYKQNYEPSMAPISFIKT